MRNKALNDEVSDLNGAMTESKERKLRRLNRHSNTAELERGKLQAKCKDIDANIVPQLNDQIQKLKEDEEVKKRRNYFCCAN